MSRPARATVEPIAAVLTAAAFLLYVTTLSQQHTADARLYVWAIDFGHWRDLIDPYHLLMHPLQWAWVELWHACGWEGSTVLPLQLLNAAGGALCVGLVCLIVAQVGGSPTAAALAAAACAVSGGLWLVSTEAEGVALPLPAHLALLALLLRLPAGAPRHLGAAFGLGALVGLGAMLYATYALLLPVALLVQVQGRERRVVAPLALLAGFLVVALAALAVFVEVGLSGVWSLPQIYRQYGGGRLYGIVSWESLPRGIYAFLRTLVLYPGLGMNDRTVEWWARVSALERATLVATYAAVGVAAAAPLWLAWRHRTEWSRALRQRLVLWLALFSAFALFWVPSDLEFWVPVGVGWFVVAGLVLARGHISRLVAVIVIALLFVANARNVILPHHASPITDLDRGRPARNGSGGPVLSRDRYNSAVLRTACGRDARGPEPALHGGALSCKLARLP